MAMSAAGEKVLPALTGGLDQALELGTEWRQAIEKPSRRRGKPLPLDDAILLHQQGIFQ
jgi:hypothetical protein